MKKTVTLTKDGKIALEKELDELIKNRPVVTEKIATAREFGDLSENEEYSAARAEQKLQESRILEIQDILKSASIIKTGSKSKVVLGATVTIKMNGKEFTYTVVGPTEADPLAGKISDQSPIGKALLGRKAGEIAEFNGKKIEILGIA